GATKNVIAFAVGLADGLGYGLSTQATLISRGLVETIRFGLTLGGRVETFVGPAGVGDLTATCMSTLSRNRTLGFHMGKGLGLEEAIAATGGTAESVKSCAAIAQLAASAGVEMPITDAVTAVLHRGAAPKDMVAEAVCRSSRLLEQLERAEHGEIDSSELGALGL
ncbi:MAG: hypothetical protein LBM66_07800, partial [Bifidobacteriaceae bacterium]|nr:hypothetical protein [Bifidobacteriaceae bacterium]